MRSRWPALNSWAVDHKSTWNWYTWFGVSNVGCTIDSRYRARRIPSHTDIERPSGQTSHKRTTQSVSGADDAACSTAVTGPATQRSASSTFDVYVSTRSSIGRWSLGPSCGYSNRLGTGSRGSYVNVSGVSSETFGAVKDSAPLEWKKSGRYVTPAGGQESRSSQRFAPIRKARTGGPSMTPFAAPFSQ